MRKITLLVVICISHIAGCATVSYPPPSERLNGIYHTVGRNETLWGIARAYDVTLAGVINTNRIPDKDKIEVGQRIFIPGGKEKKSVGVTGPAESDRSFIWPVRGKIIAHFGAVKEASKNKGIDISASYGTGIMASRSGKISFISDSMKGYGKTIIIDHGDGYQTVYAYNAENLVKEGSYVKQNQIIGKVGKGGRARLSSLHFEIRKNHKPQNPFHYLI